VLRTIEAIGNREGLGALLAEGTRRAAEIVGQGSDAWAMQVKGLEMPGYHPRKLQTLALGLAVATRGACHNRSSAYEVDLSDRLDPQAEAEAMARAAIDAEDQAALLDSLTICKFLRHCFDDLPAESAALFSAVTGIEASGDDLRQAAARINTLKKLFNIRQGWKRADDSLPPRVFEPAGSGPAISPVRLEALIDAYYRARGWDANGLIPAASFEALGLHSILSEVTMH
jgi:aldehyde:ferredoxin oxidoreductase